MKIIVTTAALALALAGGSLQAGASLFGYCTDNLSRNNIFRVGTSETQGACIRLGADKIAMLKGSTIAGVCAAFGSSRTTGGTATIFVAATPGGEPIVSQTAKIASAVKWLDFSFDTPYVISGEEQELYIGYTAEINTKSSMLLGDMSADASGLSFVYNDGEWTDTYGLGFGAPCIRVDIPDAPQLADLMVKPLASAGYLKSGDLYPARTQLFNFGNVPVESFKLNVAIGSEQQVIGPVEVAVPQYGVYDIDCNTLALDLAGSVPVKVSVAEINGVAVQENDGNTSKTAAFFYPADMERSILVEGFTGQDCHNCPTGHGIVEAFVNADHPSKIIEVMHHAGYQPDVFTMDADMDYTLFYGSTSTFAPAVMVNRTVCPSVGSVPVMNTSTANLDAAYARADAREPYVSLSLSTTFNPDSREVKVKFRTFAHRDMPEGDKALNLMLVQDGLQGRQQPYGDGYTHNAVFRGVLTGNSWGVLLSDEAVKAGGEATWEKTFTLPDYIFSDYWGIYDLTPEQKLVFSTASVPADISVVAYVADFGGADVTGHFVYNAVEVPLGQSYTQGGISGVEDVAADPVPSVRVEGGRIVVDGACDSVCVFTLSGRSVSAEAELAPGVYIVRAVSGTAVSVKKIMVR